jgi:Protein of unknown function (DUF2877)
VLRAISWDRVAETLAGEATPLRVHSLFERALNLVTRGGELLGLVGPRAGNGPATIVLAALPTAGLDQFGLSPGTAARISATGLDVGGRLQVDLTAAHRWEPARLDLTLLSAEIRARLAPAERIARESARAGGLAPLLPHLAALAALDAAPPGGLDALGRAAWAGLGALLPPWRRGDAAAVGQAAIKLVGLGPGLTPSGDDLLAGLLVGTARSRGTVPTELGQACLAAARGRTTDIALARLRHAARGAIEEVQEDVLAGLLGAGDPSFDVAVARAARWGHTSGVDTLVGLFLGARLELLRAWPLAR